MQYHLPLNCSNYIPHTHGFILFAISQLGTKKYRDEDYTYGIPQNHWSEVEINPVSKPADHAQQKQRGKKHAYLTGTFKLEDTNELRNHATCDQCSSD